MKMKFLLLSLVAYCSLEAGMTVSEISKYTIEGKKVPVVSQGIKRSVEQIEREWKDPEDSKGYAKITFIGDMKKGKFLTFVVKKKKGDEIFNKAVKDFLRKALEFKLEKRSGAPMISATVLIQTNTLSDKVKVVKREGVYKELTKTLLKRGYSRQQIKAALADKSNNYLKSILYGVYLKYEKNQPKKADQYFQRIVRTKRYFDKISNKPEAVFIAEKLLNEKKYKDVLRLLGTGSCESFYPPYDHECYFARGVAHYYTDGGYEMDLSYARPFYERANKMLGGM